MPSAAYIAARDNQTRKPALIVVMHLDKCARTYGSAPCTATISGGSPTGTQKCFNTFYTCQDTANYLHSSDLTIKFTIAGHANPLPGETMRHYLTKQPAFVSLMIDPLGENKIVKDGTVTLKFLDEQDNDAGLDPYVDEAVATSGRPSTAPMERGTFWRKLLARNPNWIGRVVEIKRGYLGLDEADYMVQKYIMTDLQGPDKQGHITVKLQDILKTADFVKIPKATSGTVADNPLTAGATTVNLDDASEYNDPAVTGRNEYILIEDEIIKYTGVSGNALTGCARGQFGTTAAQHDQDEKVQQCWAVDTSTNVYDIMDRILQEDVGIAAADIDTTSNEAERDVWALGWNFTGIVTKPTKSSDILTELMRQSLSVLYWGPDAQKVLFRSLKFPLAEVATITDPEDDVLDNALEVDPNMKQLITRPVVYFDRRTGISEKDKQESYPRIQISPDLTVESASAMGREEQSTIFANWMTQTSQASRLASLQMRRFTGPPRRMTFPVDASKADLEMLDIVEVVTDKVVNFDGTRREGTLCYVIGLKRESQGRAVLTVMDASLTKRYFCISPAGTPDFTSATEAQKKKYGWVGNASNKVGAGEDGYYIY